MNWILVTLMIVLTAWYIVIIVQSARGSIYPTAGLQRRKTVFPEALLRPVHVAIVQEGRNLPPLAR